MISTEETIEIGKGSAVAVFSTQDKLYCFFLSLLMIRAWYRGGTKPEAY